MSSLNGNLKVETEANPYVSMLLPKVERTKTIKMKRQLTLLNKGSELKHASTLRTRNLTSFCPEPNLDVLNRAIKFAKETNTAYESQASTK